MIGFHPLVVGWFLKQVGKPTSLQEEAWPAIAAGEHVLLAAPTGSGKTFAAFLWAMNQLLSGQWPLGRTSVLYVSPLKALNNDIQRNLLQPLEELKALFQSRGADYPQLTVMTRSGDTPHSHRRQMLRRPPEILITTPESLNLILSSPLSRSILRDIRCVILDEVHALIGNKRGVHLITAVDRLVPLCGEFQRIGLSATIRPLEPVAEFIGGYKMEEGPQYSARRVRSIQSSEKKSYEIRVGFPGLGEQETGTDSFWIPYTREVKEVIRRNRSTLIFANSRRLCEKLTHLINIDEEKPLAYAHHGSLSREIRTEVEEKLKCGDLKAIVATNSLELGIDIGELDEVILIQSPPSISSAIQRIGRAGHRVGQVSRGTLYPTDPFDIIEAAVLARGVVENDIELTRPTHSPLDVLAQVIISMVGVETWDLEGLFNRLRTSSPYRNLPREHFDLVIQMLAGEYHGTHLRELKPRISLDRLDHTVAARKGSLQALYLSGGTIPDRGYYHLRHHESNAKIGDLDEEFVWEASVGQVFTLGTQNWKIERITHNDVFVTPARSRVTAPPFWKAEERLRGFHFSERIGEFLERVNDRLDDPHLESSLRDEYFMDEAAVSKLLSFLKEQRRVTGCALPHRHHLLVEQVGSGPGGYPGRQVVLHSTWGGSVNKPYAMALEAAWDELHGHQLEVFVSNDAIVLQLPDQTSKEEILSLVRSANLGDLLRRKLESSGYFGARFRENAGRALLLPRRKGHERMPLWLSRLRSQKLLGSVMRFHDFPILLETWRACLRDDFDMESLHRMLGELERGIIGCSETHTSNASPMARSATWGQINRYMYLDDSMRSGKADYSKMSGKASMLRREFIQDVIFTPALRPAVSESVIEQFELKRKRLIPGYSPETSRDLLDWVKERLLMPASEWERLLEMAHADHHVDRSALLGPIAGKVVRLCPPAASEPLMAALEMLPNILRGIYPDTRDFPVELLSKASVIAGLPPPEAQEAEDDEDELFLSLLGDWLQFYGPVQQSFICATLGCSPERVRRGLEDLAESEKILIGSLVKDSDQEFICDSGNFELLLRVARAEARPAFEAIDCQWLPLFLAQHQGITAPATGVEGLFQRIEQLLFLPEAAELWESEIFPARLASYETEWLDTLMQSGDLSWIGSERRQVSFYFKSDLLAPTSAPGTRDVAPLFADSKARYDFVALVHRSGSRPSEVVERLWNAVWHGHVAVDSFVPLRQGVETGFRTPSLLEGARGRKVRGMGFSRWRNSYPFAGNWQLTSDSAPEEDLIEKEERDKDRVRVLLERYGILFREILQNESAPFRWSSLFRTLRLMELSGEILTGYFFHGVPGPHFISHKAFRALQGKLPEDAVYWVSAVDPASPCGSAAGVLKSNLPRRIPGNHLVYHGPKLVLVSQRNGRRLSIHVSHDHDRLKEYWCVLHHLLERKFQPLRRVVVETINEEQANGGPYLESLAAEFDLSVGHKKVTLYQKTTHRK